MNITIDQILCLKAVYDEGSLTKASEKIFKAKSAINYSLKVLEEQLGFKLLDKSAYRPRLTPKGEEFLFKSKSLISEYELLLENSKQIFSGVEMKLALSASSICSLGTMYTTIKNAMLKYPSTEITLNREILSGEIMLEKGIVDLALFEHLNNTQDYDYKIVDRLSLPLVISHGHPFLELPKKEQTKRILTKYPHIIQKSTISGNLTNRSVEADEIKWEVTDILSKKELIQEGLGWGRLPDHMIKADLKSKKLVQLKHLDTIKEMKVFLCRKKNIIHGEVNNFIWNSF